MDNILKDKILKLKKEKDALILAHYYQKPEVQDIADFVGDSYYLSKKAKQSSEHTIVFCGVRFMAESAKILCPDKKILAPSMNSQCSMAMMATTKQLKKMKRVHPNAKVVCYINSCSEIKAISDVCCTSSSVINIVKNLNSKEIIFLPDKNLGEYVQEQMPDKNIIIWNGHCYIHDNVTEKDILEAKKNYGQDSKVLSHLECNSKVRKMSDFTGSTSDMINYIQKDDGEKYIVITDEGILHELKCRMPNKKFYTLKNMRCTSMKNTTLNNVYECLKDFENEVLIDEVLRKKAYRALQNMHILGER